MITRLCWILYDIYIDGVIIMQGERVGGEGEGERNISLNRVPLIRHILWSYNKTTEYLTAELLLYKIFNLGYEATV